MAADAYHSCRVIFCGGKPSTIVATTILSPRRNAPKEDTGLGGKGGGRGGQ